MSDTLAAPAPGKEPSKTKRNIVVGMMIILLLMLLFLFYYYLTMLKPSYRANSVRVETEQYRAVLSIKGPSLTDHFSNPTDVAVDRDRNIYVADSGKSRIVVFDERGNYLRKIGKKGKNKGEIYQPFGIDIDADNNIYVTDKKLHKIMILNPNGTLKKEWMVMWPHIPKIINEKLYVTTYGPLFIYDKDGKELRKIGKRGKAFKDLNMAHGIIGNQSTIYVADFLNARIATIKNDAELNWALGQPYKSMNETNPRFQAPLGIEMDEYGLIYVADALDSSIEILKGKDTVDKFGKNGSLDGELSYPVSLAYAGNGRLIISEYGINRVQIWDIKETKKLLTARQGNAFKDHPVAQKKSAVQSILDFFRDFLGL